jgi:hypothetical protein
MAENRITFGMRTALSNSLFTGIVATTLDDKYSIDDALRRFCLINQTLERHAVIRYLCVLGVGSYFWVKRTSSGAREPALFQDDFSCKLSIANPDGSPLYHLITHLGMHCRASVLAPEVMEQAYGIVNYNCRTFDDINFMLQPSELIDELLKISVVDQYSKTKT